MRSEGDEVDYKVGDKVVVVGHSNSYTGEVIRLTPKGFIVVKPYSSKSTITFNPNGYERTSDPWSRLWIRPLTQEDIELASMARARREAKAYFNKYSDLLSKEQAVRITEILKEVEGQVAK